MYTMGRCFAQHGGKLCAPSAGAKPQDLQTASPHHMHESEATTPHHLGGTSNMHKGPNRKNETAQERELFVHGVNPAF